jgi:uncharacterized membrane protein
MALKQISRANPAALWLARHWFAVFAVVYGAFVVLPWLAPVLMKLGLDSAGQTLYFIYSFVCHQLPQRSFFLFGAAPSYSLQAIQTAWQNTTDPMILRQFIGNAEIGWKVAWSDRMFTMYTSVWLAALVWFPLRHRIAPLPVWGAVLLGLPMILDGGTHLISDLVGIGEGFRFTNAWLASLTVNAFSTSFYVGEQLGSFNSWMRLITGTLFGAGLVWFAFPYMHESLQR